MKPRTALILIRALSLALSPLALAPAGAAQPEPPKATLVRLDLQPLDRPSPLTIANNQCVALVEARNFAAAATPCNEAISAAQRERSSSRLIPFVGQAYDDEEAATFNNRAVLRYLSGDLPRAAADARRALSTARLPAFQSTAAVIEARQHRAAEAAVTQ